MIWPGFLLFFLGSPALMQEPVVRLDLSERGQVFRDGRLIYQFEPGETSGPKPELFRSLPLKFPVELLPGEISIDEDAAPEWATQLFYSLAQAGFGPIRVETKDMPGSTMEYSGGNATHCGALGQLYFQKVADSDHPVICFRSFRSVLIPPTLHAVEGADEFLSRIKLKVHLPSIGRFHYSEEYSWKEVVPLLRGLHKLGVFPHLNLQPFQNRLDPRKEHPPGFGGWWLQSQVLKAKDNAFQRKGRPNRNRIALSFIACQAEGDFLPSLVWIEPKEPIQCGMEFLAPFYDLTGAAPRPPALTWWSNRKTLFQVEGRKWIIPKGEEISVLGWCLAAGHFSRKDYPFPAEGPRPQFQSSDRLIQRSLSSIWQGIRPSELKKGGDSEASRRQIWADLNGLEAGWTGRLQQYRQLCIATLALYFEGGEEWKLWRLRCRALLHRVRSRANEAQDFWDVHQGGFPETVEATALATLTLALCSGRWHPKSLL